jgi:ABC-type multidrug transport system fused ATPase/permease subunit
MSVSASRFIHAGALSTSFEMIPRIVIETSLVILIVLFISFSQIYSARSSEAVIATLSIFAVASVRLIPVASQVMSALGSIQNSRHVVDIFYSDLMELSNNKITNNASSRISNSPSKNLKSISSSLFFNEKIEIKNVAYRYPGIQEPAINNLSIEIEKGSSIAFIGKSGAGKTTLVDVILGLLLPQKGDIRVDNQSIYKHLREWQNLIGYIPQSIFLLDDTIAKNIAFGVPEDKIDFEKMEQAIRASELSEFIHSLPEGIYTSVGERGVRLSGGQRQRIGIARALYREREILVLDEATSSLDNETEEKVSESIQTLFGKKTVIIIAHRLSTVEKCDKIYLLDKGEIVESGSFNEVIKGKI